MILKKTLAQSTRVYKQQHKQTNTARVFVISEFSTVGKKTTVSMFFALAIACATELKPTSANGQPNKLTQKSKIWALCSPVLSPQEIQEKCALTFHSKPLDLKDFISSHNFSSSKRLSDGYNFGRRVVETTDWLYSKRISIETLSEIKLLNWLIL